MNNDSPAIVQLEGVTKRFSGPVRAADVVALDHVSLEVQRGEFVALLGPSGCGKTTLLRILAGMEAPTTGRVMIDGQDMTNVPPEQRPVNMVFQSPALFPHRSVFENIAFGPRMAGASADQIASRVAAILALVQLEGYGSRRVTQLSGGQSQRVALARALINRPKVLLLDEPLSALDLKLRKAMQIELKRIHRQLGTTFIYVTHDQEEAIVMADRIVIINLGHVVQVGTPDAIYRRPSSVFAADFIGESNLLKATVTGQGSGDVIARVGELEIRAAAQQPVSIGQSVWVSIRPEKVRLTNDASGLGPNYFSGEIADVYFLGALVRYDVVLAGGARLAVLEDFHDDRPLCQPGSRVRVSWSSEHCLVLTE